MIALHICKNRRLKSLNDKKSASVVDICRSLLLPTQKICRWHVNPFVGSDGCPGSATYSNRRTTRRTLYTGCANKIQALRKFYISAIVAEFLIKFTVFTENWGSGYMCSKFRYNIQQVLKVIWEKRVAPRRIKRIANYSYHTSLKVNSEI